MSPEKSPLIIALLEDHPKALLLLKAAHRKASKLGGRWKAIYVSKHTQGGHYHNFTQENALKLLTLAQQMGGEAADIDAETVEKGVRSVLEEEAGNTALFIIGSTDKESGFLSKLRKPQWERIAKLAKKYTTVELVQLEGGVYRKGFLERLRLTEIKPLHILYSLLSVLAAFAGAEILQLVLPPALFRINIVNVGLLFMIACAFSSGRYGLIPGLVASAVGFLTMNNFYILPYKPVEGLAITDLINMAIFISAALLISLLTSQTRHYADKAAKRELSTQTLFAFYKVASSAHTTTQAIDSLRQNLEQMLKMDVAFFLPPTALHGTPELASPLDIELNDIDKTALSVCWNEMKTTGYASPFNPGTFWRFEPMMSLSGEIGVIGFRPKPKERLGAWYVKLFAAIADQTASIIERIELGKSMEATRVSEEREKLRSMLLSSVSHDLKTPLAAILGSLSILHKQKNKLNNDRKNELMDTAIEETQRLERFISNILDMTRLESGSVQFKRDWHSIESLVQPVLKRLDFRLRNHKIEVHRFPSDLEIYVDAMMTEQVIQNLLDNACKYTKSGTMIEIYSYVDDNNRLHISIRDHGEGLPTDMLGKIFDKYARIRKKDMQVAGTGLGLSICKAIVEAQDGTISAGNHPEGGAVFSISIAKWRKIETLAVMNKSLTAIESVETYT